MRRATLCLNSGLQAVSRALWRTKEHAPAHYVLFELCSFSIFSSFCFLCLPLVLNTWNITYTQNQVNYSNMGDKTMQNIIECESKIYANFTFLTFRVNFGGKVQWSTCGLVLFVMCYSPSVGTAKLAIKFWFCFPFTPYWWMVKIPNPSFSLLIVEK